MASDFTLQHLRDQAAAFREAVARTDGRAAVPTCPGWDSLTLLRHLARVYSMASIALRTSPDEQPSQFPVAPRELTDALSWFDDRLTELHEALSTEDNDGRVWSWVGPVDPGWWARRAAHETAIHRLDMEHALADLGADRSDELLFDPTFAADGIDEMLTVLFEGTRDWEREHYAGKVLYHAADAGRTWLVTYHDTRPPEVGVPHDPALARDEVDSTVAGTADALFRKVWGRPSHALVQGDEELATLVNGVGPR
ncbi:hypothetical protein GIY23_21095 [Allosaccharopolyspora coralli]|uniref:Maleylpyruvate isomerase family mycothiol-dependent enzyme n=1 Tax=Allosaccharopolyspora coralli TaxID=2665642 RepID=A0A5Q3QEM8_9PSEU|nr:maleylpyruvate isomerase N-terminal domain-containing protein [Allosaccharopolyspora coralli]QGK71684.1 hypothetical protein GIY23_21095 [Allosaccharopolyspora coralli]